MELRVGDEFTLLVPKGQNQELTEVRYTVEKYSLKWKKIGFAVAFRKDGGYWYTLTRKEFFFTDQVKRIIEKRTKIGTGRLIYHETGETRKAA